jgi:hypothetical protein
MRRSVALLLPLAAMIAGCGAAHHLSAGTAPLTGNSSCVEWTNASELQRSTFAKELIQSGAVPAQYHSQQGQAELEQEIINRCNVAATQDVGLLLSEAVPQDTTTTATSSTQSTTSTDSYPVVHWTHERWPFTLQIASVTTQVEGIGAAGSAPPGEEWMIIRTDVTLQSPGRSTFSPELEDQITCSLPHHQRLEPAGNGYEEPPGSNELVPHSSVGFVSGQTHVWTEQYEVNQGASTANLRCGIYELEPGHVPITTRTLPLT